MELSQIRLLVKDDLAILSALQGMSVLSRGPRWLNVSANVHKTVAVLDALDPSARGAYPARVWRLEVHGCHICNAPGCPS